MTRILERVHFDHFRLDVHVVSAKSGILLGSPWITVCVDEKSGYPLGFSLSFEPPSYRSLMHCLLHAIMPKTYVKERYPSVEHDWEAFGVPERIVVDDGEEFRGRVLEDNCNKLGIRLTYQNAITLRFRGMVERAFSKVEQGRRLAHNLNGYLDPQENTPTQEDYPRVLLMTLMETLHVFVVDTCAHRPQPDGTMPTEIWHRGFEAFPPAMPCTEMELMTLLPWVERSLTERGVLLEGLSYNSPGLTSLWLATRTGGAGRKFEVRYDPADLGRVWVYDHLNARQYTEAICEQQTYAKGLSLWEHRALRLKRRAPGFRLSILALQKAKANIAQIVMRSEVATTTDTRKAEPPRDAHSPKHLTWRKSKWRIKKRNGTSHTG